MLTPTFTVCVLLYGDYPVLARRCLDSILAGRTIEELRIGMNQIGDDTRQYMRQITADGRISATDVYDSGVNLCKYPMMRRMLYDSQRPITSDFVAWFDDDTCILPTHLESWWTFLRLAADEQTDILGKPYQIGWQGGQREWVKQQPWYNGKDPANRPVIKFLQGGWWCCRTALLREFNYPWPELLHNGGDTMLGELAFQQNWRRKPFETGLAINAGPDLRHSSAPRRGFSAKPLGMMK